MGTRTQQSATVPRGTQWCVHNVSNGPLGWCPGVSVELFCLREPRPPNGGTLHDFFSFSQLLFWSRFLTPLRNLVFSTFGPRSLPKWSPNGHQNRRKLVPTAFQKNIHKIIRIFVIFTVFSKRSMFQKHCKLQYGTMFFLEPSPAQHLPKNTKKHVENHSKILQKWCLEAFQNRSQKISPNKHRKNRKNTENV